MKKGLLFLASLFLIAGNVDAAPCKTTKGDGTHLGDEIVCGSENFYVLENDGTNIKMLSKYNLYVGKDINEGTVYLESEHPDPENYDLALSECESLANIYGQENVNLTGKYQLVDEEIDFVGYFCRYYTDSTYTEVKQDPKAIGLKVSEDGFLDYPIYGDVRIDGYDDKDFIDLEGDLTIVENLDENGNYIIKGSKIEKYISGYNNYLTSKGVKIKSIDFIHRSTLEKIIKDILKEEIKLGLPINSEGGLDYDDLNLDVGLDSNNIYHKINIKTYIPEEYKWLYSTSYWTGTGNIILEDDMYTDEFLTTNGDYCSSQRGCNIERMGIGLRPVVEMSVDNLVDKESTPETYDHGYTDYVAIGLVALSSLIICKRKANAIK